MTPHVPDMDWRLHNFLIEFREQMIEVSRLLNVTLDQLCELHTNDPENLKKRYIKALKAEAKKYG